MKKHKIYTALIFLLMLCMLVSCKGEETDTTEYVPVSGEAEPEYAVKDVDGAQLISGINSETALIVKLSDLKAVAAKRSAEKMYPASLTKIMTFVVAYENAKSMNDKTAITKEMKNQYPGASRFGIDVGDILTTEQLLYVLLLESDTDAALALAEYVAGGEDEFVELMNQKCVELGLENTKFANITGLHNKEHYTTAQEMMSIFAYALEIEMFRTIITTETYVTYLEWYNEGVLDTYRNTFQNTTISPNKGRFPQNGVKLNFLENGRIIGGKTGYTDEAKYCQALLVVGDGGEEYLVITGKADNAKLCAEDCHNICKSFAK